MWYMQSPVVLQTASAEAHPAADPDRLLTYRMLARPHTAVRHLTARLTGAPSATMIRQQPLLTWRSLEFAVRLAVAGVLNPPVISRVLPQGSAPEPLHISPERAAARFTAAAVVMTRDRLLARAELPAHPQESTKVVWWIRSRYLLVCDLRLRSRSCRSSATRPARWSSRWWLRCCSVN